MRWLERLLKLENFDLPAGELQKPQEGPSCTFYSPRPQVSEVLPGLGRADVPGEWAAGVARLRTMSRPIMVRPDRWQQGITDAGRFLHRWGIHAAALGWTTLDVFGAHPTHPIERLDCAGLILLLRGDELLAMTAQIARIRAATGTVTTYYRRADCGGAVPLWRLADAWRGR